MSSHRRFSVHHTGHRLGRFTLPWTQGLPLLWLCLFMVGLFMVGGLLALARPAAAQTALPTYLTKWGSLGSSNGQFYNPAGVATDSSGNVYIADTYNHRIQKFSSSGVYLAQWGSQGSGNGQFIYPYGVAIDSSGNVYVADLNNRRIQKFSSSGLYLAQWGGQGSGNGQFKDPTGVATDSSGNVYVVDFDNHRIQKFSSSGVYLAQWGSYGSGNGQFNNPFGVAIDSSGNVYIADRANHRIQKFSSSGVYLAQWGSLGSGNGQFNLPYGVATDSSGNVYVADFGNHRIQQFSSSGLYLTQWGSNGAGNGQFNNPAGIATDNSGNVYIAERANHRVQKFSSGVNPTATATATNTPTATPTPTPTATPTVAPPPYLTQWGSQGSGNSQFYHPSGVATDSSGNVYVADTYNHRIQKFSSSGVYLAQWGSQGSGNGQFIIPYGVATDSSGNVYVADRSNHRIQQFSSSGVYLAQWGSYGSGNGQFKDPTGIATDSSGNVYVADLNNHRIQKFSSSGVYLTQWGSYGSGNGQFNSPFGVAIDSSGNVYVTDRNNHRIQKFSSSGLYLAQWGSLGSGNGQFNIPFRVATDSSGNVYVVDFNNHRIQQFSSSGVYLTKWGSYGTGNGQFNYPFGVATDSSGNVYVTDFENHRIQKFSSGVNPTATPTPTATATATNTPTPIATLPPTLTPTATATATPLPPSLVVQGAGVSLVNGNQLNVPVTFTGNGKSIASVGFALDYQESCLAFDATDSDGNGVPDAVTGLPTAFAPSISHQPSKSSGELEIALYDDSSPISTLSDGALFTVQFTVLPACLPTANTPTTVAINFAQSPAVSFGDPTGTDVSGKATGATITLQYINTAPTALSLDNSSVAENSLATTVGAFTTTDVNSGDSHTYTLVSGLGDSDNASFTITGNTLKTTAVFDYESKSSYVIRVRTTDGGGLFFEQSFTISVTDVTEAPTAVDDLVDPRVTIFLGGEVGAINVLANDIANGGVLQVASVTQPAAGGGSVTNNTTNVSYTAPNASGSTTFTYQATNGTATSNNATVSVNYVANHARGDCNGNGGVSAADFIGIVLEIFDANNTKYNGNPAWWLTYTGDYAGSPLGCDANNSRNGANNSSASITAADITCAVLIFFGHACGTGVQAASADGAAALSVAAVANGGQTTIPVTLKSGAHAVAAAAFALNLGDSAFAATDANGDSLPDAVTLNVPAGVTKSVIWNAAAKRLEVALYGVNLPLPTLADGVLATVTVDGVVTPALTQLSLSDANGNDLLVPTRTGLFLPLVAR